MDNSQSLDARAFCVVDIFIKHEASVIAVFAAQVDFGIKFRDHALCGFFSRVLLAVFISKGDLHAVDKHEVFDIGLGLDDARLHLHVAALIGIAEKNAFLSDGNEDDFIALLERTGQLVIFHSFRVNGVEIIAIIFQVELDIALCRFKRFGKIFAFALFFHLFQLCEDEFAGKFRAFHHADSSGSCFFQFFFRFLFALGNEIVHFRFFASCLREEHFRLGLGNLHFDALFFKALDHGFKAAVFAGNIAFRAFNN